MALALPVCKRMGPSTPSLATLYQLLCGVNHFMCSVDARAPNVIAQKNPDFKELYCTMDSIFCLLRVEGVGAQIKYASVITREE